VFSAGLFLGYPSYFPSPSFNPLTWEIGTEHLYRRQFSNKLDKIIVGYTGGHTSKPSYSQVCSGSTGHAEAVQITFDPTVVSYETLVDFFFRMHGEFCFVTFFH
jgi:methionine-S-sulfoxide reductase